MTMYCPLLSLFVDLPSVTGVDGHSVSCEQFFPSKVGQRPQRLEVEKIAQRVEPELEQEFFLRHVGAPCERRLPIMLRDISFPKTTTAAPSG